MHNHPDDLSEIKPPKLANKIMSLLLPNRFLENVIGDLEEEFYQIARKDSQLANKWYWRQSIETSLLYFKKKIASIEVLGRLNFYLSTLLFIVVATLIILLSALEDPEFISPTFWTELLQGKIHTALFSDNFWRNFWNILRMADWQMFIHFKSLLIVIINILVLSYLDKKNQVSVIQLAIFGYVLAITPYVLGLVNIANHSFKITQIGPIIATGVLSFLYMILPISYFVHRKLKRQQAELKIFEKHRIEKESV